MKREIIAEGGSTVRALLFDYGGTIAFLDFDLLAEEFSRPGRILDPLRLEHTEYQGRAALDCYLMSQPTPNLSMAYDKSFQAWMAAVGIPDLEMQEVVDHFRALHGQQCLWRILREGTVERLDDLKSAGLKLGVVSNADGRVAADARRLGIEKYFDVIIDSKVVGVEKPDPKIFQLALNALGVTPEEALFAGDVYSIDMLGARAAGIAGKLIDQLGLYHWVKHEKIRHFGELHRLP